ncbi:hypothetical protein SAMN04487961_1027 [Marinobacter pelagius]|uniref:Uncharacterized protein n=1 Tax=Marinobacter pelagius TaxID=379482 RepID=A0A1I4T6P6_9GAMM|nr:hypothetical protein SAMN04487961_1027 [Marinobacter pelagius]
MQIVIQKCPRCIWHINCPENPHKSGVVKDYPPHGDVTPIQCMHCGQKGSILRGTHFDVDFEAGPPVEHGEES